MKIDKSWYLKSKPKNFPIRQGAGGVIVRKVGKRLLVGLARDNGFPDYILPKGGRENGETDVETARREIAEETGFVGMQLICDLGVRERMTFEKNYWSVMRYFLFTTKQKDGKSTDPVENYTIEWFDLDDLPPIFWPEQKELIEESKEKIKNLLF